MANKYNISPGIISVLHTFGEKKEFHVHVHMIVSWGGIDIKTKELRAIKGEYIDYNFLKNKFRCKFEDQLVAMYDNGTLEHNFSDRTQFLKFIKSANQNKWIIHLEPPMDIPTQVIRYIGRYSKRACLSEYKITKMDGETICFRYKDYKTTDSNNKPVERELEMNYRDFFPRLLQHVPLPYFRIVRYYGMYANRSDIPQQYLYNEKEGTTGEENGPMQMEETVEDPLVCSHCQTRKIYLYTKLKSRYAKNPIVFKRVFINNSKPHEQMAA